MATHTASSAAPEPTTLLGDPNWKLHLGWSIGTIGASILLNSFAALQAAYLTTVMGVAAAPNGTLCGGTAFPMRFFSFNPKTDSWINCEAYGQFNTVARQGERFFFGGYGHGFLLEWNPSQPWVDSKKGKPGCNPLFLTARHFAGHVVSPLF